MSTNTLAISKRHVPHRKPCPEKYTVPRADSLPPRNSAEDGLANVLQDNSTHPNALSSGSSTRQSGRLQKPPPAHPQHSPPPPPAPQVVTQTSESTPVFQFTETRSPVRLQKQRSNSVNADARYHLRSSSNLMPPPSSPPPNVPLRSPSAHAVLGRSPTDLQNHVIPPARPGSSNGSQNSTVEAERHGRSRRSWFPGVRSRSQSVDNRQDAQRQSATGAWILGQNSDYNTAFLSNRDRVPELWNESGDVLVYLGPKGSCPSPSFKVYSYVTRDSLLFADLIEAGSPASLGERAQNFIGRDSLSVSDATRRIQSPPVLPPSPEPPLTPEIRLYIPVSTPATGHGPDVEIERLTSIRNMFAFLTGQPLVATKSQPTLFAVFMNISNLLKEFEFTNEDGSTFGDAVEMSFSFFIEQMGLADVRQSREKTLESLVLGERMRSTELYSEAFAHAVGKYSAMRELPAALWEQLYPSTRQRLERAHFDLVGRQHGVNSQLESFEFPALFTGTANSSSSVEYKDIKFHTWRKSFGRMRQFVLNYYKGKLGSWPPKARNKKNPFTESGLNRQVLKILYSDFCALYDLLADRESITTRVIDQNAEDIGKDHQNPRSSALRKILSEFDQSSPPVLPPIPFDLPRLPDMASVQENFHFLSPKEQNKLMKGLQEYQIILILNKAYDFDTSNLRVPFLEEFKEFELKEAKGKTPTEMADHRLGYWLFLYVVIQSLPMLVVDAPGLKFTEGVEYFLCQPPKGSLPWMEDAPAVRKRWYEVAGGGGLVELSEDAVEFGIEGIYHRSHCWLAAKQWEMGNYTISPPPPDETLLALEAPQPVFEDMDLGITASPSPVARNDSPLSGPPGLAIHSRTGSPAGRHASHRSSVVLGLEPVSLPLNAPSISGNRISSVWGAPGGPRPTSAAMRPSRSAGNLPAPSSGSDSRSSSRQDITAGSTFDDILKDIGESKQPVKKKKGLF
ncbi:hypothetical protein GGS21DRAFT_517469 [Xylaria nigripes]|nr:hypothetical protein GGS21DRAFT_517469 [Xylaria nigripes]